MFSPAESALLQALAQLVSKTIELRARYLAADDPDGWEKAQRELETTLDDNFALARYLATRTQGINLEDEEVAQLLKLRLERMGEVLQKRLEF